MTWHCTGFRIQEGVAYETIGLTILIHKYIANTCFVVVCESRFIRSSRLEDLDWLIVVFLKHTFVFSLF